MLRIRSKKLLSGVSAFAIMAAVGAVSPAHAAGSTFTGPANFPAIVDPLAADFIRIETAANILASSGSSISISSTETIGINTQTAINITDSTLQGAISNAGTITATLAGDRGIYASASQLLGGISNTGGIFGGLHGIEITAGSNLFNGIVNSGNITGVTGNGIEFTGNTFTGGIDNQAGGLISGVYAISLTDGTAFTGGITNAGLLNATGGTGIVVEVNSFTGGIDNSGQITATDQGIYISGDNDTFVGGIINSGTISAGNTGININPDVSFTGGINNSGLISAGEYGIYINGAGTFGDGIINSGNIAADATGIYINIESFLGGIDNTGTISSDNYGIEIDSSNGVFEGGIVNSGLISADSYAIYTQGALFSGGIDNTGTIVSDVTAIYLAGDTFNGGITNSGTISGATAIYVSTSVFNGGINNSGLLSGGNDIGIYVTGNTTFTGGIVNSGTILTGSSYGVYISNTTFAGGINNSGSLVSGATALYISLTHLEGDINNSGYIYGATGALYLSGTTWEGSFINSGTLDGGTSIAADIGLTTWVGNFTNSGKIYSSTEYGIDIEVTSWEGDFTNSGTIDSYYNAVDIDASTSWAGNFLNSGTIVSRSSTGVYISGATFSGNFTNSGTIEGLGGTGVYLGVTNITGDFTNSGLIRGVTGGVYFAGSQFNGNFLNSGTIVSTTSEGVSFYLDNMHGNITNTGLIRGYEDALKLTDGIVLDGDIANSGSIISLNQDGVDINDVVEGRLTNTGLIQGFRDGIDIDGVVEQGIFTSGTIIGFTGNAIDLSGADDLHIVTQTGGLIDGDFDMNNAFADIYYANGGTYQGDILADATDIVSVGPNSPMAFASGSLDGALEIDFVSGEGILGSTALGVDGAGFDITNVADMTVRRNAAAYLDNHTTVDLTDDLLLEDGGETASDIPGGTLMYFLTPNEAVHGQINAADTATIDGGNIVVFADSGTFAQGLQYTYLDVITATGGVSGSFDNVSSSSIFFDVFADVNANSVDLRLTRLAFGDAIFAFGGSQNQVAVADALDDIYAGGGASADFLALRDYLLLYGTPEEAARVFDDMHGAEHAQTQRALLAMGDNFSQAVGDRLDLTKVSLRDARSDYMDGAAFEVRYAALSSIGTDAASSAAPGTHGLATRSQTGVSLWGRGTGTMASVDGDANAPGYDQDGGGLVGGIDFTPNDSSAFGLAGGWQTASVDFDSPGDEADIDGWNIAGYGTMGLGEYYLDGSINAGFYNVESTRFINNGVFTGNALSDHDATSLGAAAAFGTVMTSGKFALQPSLGLAYNHVSVDEFTETGAGVFNLNVSDADADSLATTLGLRATTAWKAGTTRLLPSASIGWRHEFLDDSLGFTGSFQEDPSTLFNIVSSDISRDSFLFGVGMAAAVSEKVEVFVDYKGMVSGDADGHNGSLGARFSW